MSSSSINKPDIYEKPSRREIREKEARRSLREQMMNSSHLKVVVLGDQEDVTI